MWATMGLLSYVDISIEERQRQLDQKSKHDATAAAHGASRKEEKAAVRKWSDIHRPCVQADQADRS